MHISSDTLNSRDFQKGQRVYYKFNEQHPYEEQPLNDSKNYGKGMIIGFAGTFIVVKTNSCSGSKENPWMLFRENELLTIKEYYSCPDNER
jgi:hypothetical protein